MFFTTMTQESSVTCFTVAGVAVMTFTMLVNEVTCTDKAVIASMLCTPADHFTAGCLAEGY